VEIAEAGLNQYAWAAYSKKRRDTLRDWIREIDETKRKK
jgi:hypothetical protein